MDSEPGGDGEADVEPGVVVAVNDHFAATAAKETATIVTPRPLLVAVADPSGRAPFLLVPWTHSASSEPPPPPIVSRFLTPLALPSSSSNTVGDSTGTGTGSGMDTGTGTSTSTSGTGTGTGTGVYSVARIAATSLWAPSSIPMRNGNTRTVSTAAAAPPTPVYLTTPLATDRSSTFTSTLRGRSLPLDSHPTPNHRATHDATFAVPARDDPQGNSWPPAEAPITVNAFGSLNPLLARARALLAAAQAESVAAAQASENVI